ncbi:hypothetical protein Rumeso_02937 [Rubellimicrobium mesophilum DSM 19309]|uniref:Curlin n=1 Tax=Rubellimicrobium mesophilum DSM 19309 TaxID=442562 RepID=A0A017HNU7_9RHOB|nr:hypothetical protein [Rubellimicrobium mesophilum]EYD75454.1 hypothetical protein Rumeso_02937 [Rubellimicrobium mesophilum DSM 19309]
MFRPIAILLLVLSPLGAGAETLSATWTPHGDRAGEALRRAFEAQALRRGASVLQSGRNNQAALSQSGADNQGLIVQRGSGHSATLDQTGGGNAYAIIQLGRGARTQVAQTGGEAGVSVQYGW